MKDNHIARAIASSARRIHRSINVVGSSNHQYHYNNDDDDDNDAYCRYDDSDRYWLK